MRRLPGWLILPLLLTSLFVAVQSSAQQVYSVDPAASDIHWLVYKAGAFARLGHNHIISVGELTGRVTVKAEDLASSTSSSRFRLPRWSSTIPSCVAVSATSSRACPLRTTSPERGRTC